MNIENIKKTDAPYGGSDPASEIKSGKSVFVMKTACSETATETLEQKLKKLILDAAVKSANSYQSVQDE